MHLTDPVPTDLILAKKHKLLRVPPRFPSAAHIIVALSVVCLVVTISVSIQRPSLVPEPAGIVPSSLVRQELGIPRPSFVGADPLSGWRQLGMML